MKRINLIILFVLTGFLTALLHAQNIPSSGKSYHTIEKDIDTLVKQVMGNKVPGMTVAVSKKGRLVFSKGYGYANYERRIPMKRTHRSRIGSVSKIITALGIMKLSEERSNFDLNRKLYFSSGIFNTPLYTNAIKEGARRTNTPIDWYRKMEVRHLLSHTVGYDWSGTGKNNKDRAEHFGIPESKHTNDHYRAFFLATKKINKAPGTYGKYSNYAVGTCGNIIEKIVGIPYGRYIDNKIFKPLGLSGKIVPNKHRRDKYDAYPHKIENGRIITLNWPGSNNQNSLEKGVSAAGDWAASAQSLIRIMLATDKLSNHPDILKASTIDLMEKRPFPNTPGEHIHAIGWAHEKRNGGIKLSHGGLFIPGGRAFIAKYMGGFTSREGYNMTDINVAICANIQNISNSDIKKLASDVAKVVAKTNIPSSFDLFKDIPGRYIGVFRSSSNDQRLWVGAEWNHFTKKWEEFSRDGYRLIDIDTYVQNGKRLYNGVFRKGAGAYALYKFDSWGKFTKMWQKLNGEGQRLIDVETFKSGNKRYYIGVWRGGRGGYALYQYDSWDKFTKKWKELNGEGKRLIDVETFKSGNNRYYVGVWREGEGGYALYQYDNWDSFANKWRELAEKNRRLVDIETFRANGKRYYLGVWRAGNDGYALWHNVDWNHFNAKRQEYAKQGKYLVDLERF